MRRLSLLLALTALACDADNDTDIQSDSDVETDTQADTDADTEMDTEPDTDPPPANEAADGDWVMVAAASTCNMSFAGDWVGEASTTDDFGFTLTFTAEEGRELSCLISASDTSEFTCGDVTQSGQFGNCNGSIAVTDVSGTIVGDTAELRATMQVSSSNCGSALNCGPSPHTVSGSIE